MLTIIYHDLPALSRIIKKNIVNKERTGGNSIRGPSVRPHRSLSRTGDHTSFRTRTIRDSARRSDLRSCPTMPSAVCIQAIPDRADRPRQHFSRRGKIRNGTRHHPLSEKCGISGIFHCYRGSGIRRMAPGAQNGRRHSERIPGRCHRVGDRRGHRPDHGPADERHPRRKRHADQQFL